MSLHQNLRRNSRLRAAVRRSTRVYRVGGAQAIAALAFGTATIAHVDRIVGPGNTYVAAAKKLLAGEVGIDFVAGPTEIMILAEDGDASVIAADMLAQAEHDTEARPFCSPLLERLAKAVPARWAGSSDTCRHAGGVRSDQRRKAQPDHNWSHSSRQPPRLSNMWAPEHLASIDPGLLPLNSECRNNLFGPSSPESAGDYASGPNHVLPTAERADPRRLSAGDFVKMIAIQEFATGIGKARSSDYNPGPSRRMEGHARAVEFRSVQ